MRFFIAFILSVILVFCFIPGALAAQPRTTVVDAAVITEQATHLFSIGWERGQLSVTLIAPDGTRIPQDAPPAGVRVAVSERIVIFRVDNTQPGLWKAEFQEYDNGKVGVIVQKLFRPLMVNSVTAAQQGEAILVGFSLSGEAGRVCSYDVYLTADGDYNSGFLLGSGTANTGDAVNLNLPAGTVNSYDRWQIAIYAECVTDGYTDFHSAASAHFAYANPAAPGEVKDMQAALLEGGVRLSWQPPDGENVTGYLAVLYAEDGTLLHSVTVDAAQDEAILPLAGEGKIQAGVAVLRDPLAGFSKLVTVDTSATMKALTGFDLPEKPDASGGFVELQYNARTAGVPLVIERDGVLEEKTINGDGVLRLPVVNGINRVTLSAQGADGIWLSQSRTWNIDLTPPMLRMFGDWDAANVDAEKLLVAGNADGASVLTVNGQKASLERNGNFSMEIALQEGKNLITVKAEDDAGNMVVYEARVTRGKAAGRFPWALAVGLAAAAAVIVLYALRVGRRRHT